MFAGGGTGGHLFPGIAVARELKRRHAQIEVVFVGGGRNLESRVLSNEGFIVGKDSDLRFGWKTTLGFDPRTFFNTNKFC